MNKEVIKIKSQNRYHVVATIRKPKVTIIQ